VGNRCSDSHIERIPLPQALIWRHTRSRVAHQVRFIGAGAIAVAAIYTLARLAKPVVGGLVSTLAASRATAVDDDLDRDIPPKWIFILTAACLAVSGWLAFSFARVDGARGNAVTLTLIAIPFVLIGGFLIAGICGYMAGLIGASNSRSRALEFSRSCCARRC
jgi:uncharacterized oligopeptide transporter (OPT) family protein